VCGWVVVVLRRAGQGCHCVGDIMPCGCVWRVGLGESPVHRNAMRELRAPSGPMTLTGTVGFSSHGRARVKLFRGIGPGCRGESGGEATGQEVDGGVLTELECPRWPWRLAGRRGVLA
jgi:hypothetical protein